VVFAAIVMVCLVGSLAAPIISAPRVYYATASDGLFLKAVARAHPRFGTPANTIAIQGSIQGSIASPLVFTQVWLFIAPGLLLQRITTRRPEPGMIEVAVAALQEALAGDADAAPAVAASPA